MEAMEGPSVYLVVNGELGMSPGKIAAQSFQACQRLYRLAESEPELRRRLDEWESAGTRTCTRRAKTAHLFERACRELDCAVMVDEGLTEVAPGSATCLATWPLYPHELSRMLKHKGVAVMNGPAV